LEGGASGLTRRRDTVCGGMAIEDYRKVIEAVYPDLTLLLDGGDEATFRDWAIHSFLVSRTTFDENPELAQALARRLGDHPAARVVKYRHLWRSPTNRGHSATWVDLGGRVAELPLVPELPLRYLHRRRLLECRSTAGSQGSRPDGGASPSIVGLRRRPIDLQLETEKEIQDGGSEPEDRHRRTGAAG